MSVKALDLKVCTVFSDGIIDEVYERMWALFHGFSKFNNKKNYSRSRLLNSSKWLLTFFNRFMHNQKKKTYTKDQTFSLLILETLFSSLETLLKETFL